MPDNQFAVFVIQHAERFEGHWYTAWPRGGALVLQSQQRLHNCMVGWFVAVFNWQRTFSCTFVGIVFLGIDDPLTPANQIEVDGHIFFLATISLLVLGATTLSGTQGDSVVTKS